MSYFADISTCFCLLDAKTSLGKKMSGISQTFDAWHFLMHALADFTF